MLYHISLEDLDGKILYPKVQDNEYTEAGLEDSVTPRVCFCNTIEGCISALGRNIPYGIIYNVYVPEDSNLEYVIPSPISVIDALLTGERWILNPVKVIKWANVIIKELVETCPSNHTWYDGRVSQYEQYKYDHKRAMITIPKFNTDAGSKLIKVYTYNFEVIYKSSKNCIVKSDL